MSVKIHEIVQGGLLQCYCIGFQPDVKRLNEWGFTIASSREVESDPGGHHAVIPVFAKDENGNDKESVILIDCKYTDENQYSPLAGHYDDVVLFRSAQAFVEYYSTDDEVDLGLGDDKYARRGDLNF